ncbi:MULTISPECIES: TetR/AcrR family transcriptional regulator [Rhodococcus]|uniref:TetR/AcrR family transcriptional regulator n=1 Tax=Rhodococcus TaxID=1827 RepID=UPI00117A5611|nr:MULTISPECIES: TetR/AcrR family transcriptional regulator [Rhodococcus]
MSTSPARSRRSPGRPAITSTEEILDAAERVGLDRLTRAEVAQVLGVSAATIRHHVDSTDRLYSLACARAFGRLQLDSDSKSWQDYLRTLGQRFAELVTATPGLEDYVLRGPYEERTLEQFERIMNEVLLRKPEFDRATAHLLGSRTLIMSAALHTPARNRYPDSQYPKPETLSAVVSWTLDAFLVGAEKMIDSGLVPTVVPTPDASWTHISDH